MKFYNIFCIFLYPFPSKWDGAAPKQQQNKSRSLHFQSVQITFNNKFYDFQVFCVVKFNHMYVCVCVVGGRFQERSLFCAKQMVVGDPLQSIPASENTCSYILVS